MVKIIAVDFDGTLCNHEYPLIGKAKPEVISALISEKQQGTKLILWTCRNGRELDEAITWSGEHGLEFDAINEDLPEIVNSDFGKSKSIKVFAHEYWDDKSIKID